MDSSSVLALASEARREQGAEPPVSFSARTSDPRTDEYRYSKAILRTTGSTNRHVLPNGEGMLQELDSLIWQMDEPFHSPSVYGQRKVHELARSSGIIVLLDGQGGDEALSGYHHFHYPGLLFTLLRRGHVRTWLSETRSRARLHEQGFSRTTKDMIKLLLPARFRTRHVPDWIAAGTAVPPLPVPKSDLASRQSFGLSVMPLPGFNHHNDRNSMTFSLEARNPFLDYRLVEAARSFAVEDLLHDGITKWALREAVRDVVPAEIVDRVDKQGFTTDEATWLRDHLGDEFASVFASASLAERGYYDPAKLVASLAAHRAGSSLASLWRAYIVERWLRLFIDPARLEAPPRPETALRPHVGAAANVARPKAHPETGPVEAVSRASAHPAG